MPDASNAKEYYKSYLKVKKVQLMKQSKVITKPPKIIENPHIIDIKSVIIEHQYYRS